MTPLPRSLDEIRGLRVARWIRESTKGQYDRFGPDSQREQQDRFIERHELIDTGLVCAGRPFGHDGLATREAMREMVEAAKAGRFDLLLTGYSDRWQRNLRRTLELLEDDLHPAGVALVMCDRRILSSDPQRLGRAGREAHHGGPLQPTARRAHHRRLRAPSSKTTNDQGGNAASGMRRTGEPPHTSRPIRTPSGRSSAFERYAPGTVTSRQLARGTGVGVEQHPARSCGTPIYNGWMRPPSRTGEERRPVAGDDPPVSDELWATVGAAWPHASPGGRQPGR